jgi:hypothetical protein
MILLAYFKKLNKGVKKMLNYNPTMKIGREFEACTRPDIEADRLCQDPGYLARHQVALDNWNALKTK